MTNNEYLGFRINSQLKRKLERLALQDKRSLSNYVIMILEKYVEQNEEQK